MKFVALFFIILISSCSNLDSKAILEKNSSVAASTNLTENIGIEIFGGLFVPIIEKGGQLPLVVSKIFSPAGDYQDQLTIAVFRGVSEMAKENTSLGKFEITGFTPEIRGVARIQVTFGVTKKETWIEVKDLKNNKKLKLKKV